MNSPEPQEPDSKEKLTFTITKSTRNIFLAKLLILLGLIVGGSYLFTQAGVQEYEKGLELTKEQYVEKFDQYKASLLNAKQFHDNPLLATFVVLIMVSFLIGSYELTALIISFIIGKVIRK